MKNGAYDLEIDLGKHGGDNFCSGILVSYKLGSEPLGAIGGQGCFRAVLLSCHGFPALMHVVLRSDCGYPPY